MNTTNAFQFALEHDQMSNQTENGEAGAQVNPVPASAPNDALFYFTRAALDALGYDCQDVPQALTPDEAEALGRQVAKRIRDDIWQDARIAIESADRK